MIHPTEFWRFRTQNSRHKDEQTAVSKCCILLREHRSQVVLGTRCIWLRLGRGQPRAS
ncbi:hypothetical protein OG21DRAFT_207929 [Imleria badia]|nr:hypothetical protein OG21DRAFT_207929 [Imleria badia]